LNNLKRKLLIGFGVGLCVTVFGIMAPDYAGATENQEQVVVSPAQQAVNTAIAGATTAVQEAIDATTGATTEITQAQEELSSAQTATSGLSTSVSTAQAEVNNVQTAINNINAIDTTVTQVDQSSQVVQDAKDTVIDAQTAINNIDVTTAQTEISELTLARTEAVTAQATAQTELTQANIAIDNAQNAVNALQATIGTSTNVLAGVDDAGVRMDLPFNLLMGGTLYNNVFVGSNSTITFGTNEGSNYWATPNAPSISIAGWDWTTWSTGTGITYATTGSSLDIAWDLRPFPQQDASTQMVQVRFNADVNPTNGAWKADVSAIGPIPGGARFNYRETTNGVVTDIIDTNAGTGFNGQISQGPDFTPTADPNNASVQAAVDAANATIFQLNSSISPVVAQNAINNSALSTLQSNINSLNNTVNSAVSTKTNLQTTLNTRATTLTNTINNNIPTPAPILAEPIIEGTTVTIAPELPEGYTANTWFYQVITDDPDAENPYAGGTYNTDGAPESIQLTGLTEGATYTIRIANWSGPVSQYTETVISIPAAQSSNLTGGETVDTPIEEPPAEEPTEEPTEEEPAEEEPTTEEPVEEENTEEETTEEEPSTEETTEEESVEEESTEEEILTVEEIISVVEDLVADGNLTAEDAEAVLDALMADGEITSDEVNNLSDALSEDGTFTLAEKELVADALIEAADGEPVTASDIAAAGLEYRDLPPEIPVEVRADANGNPVVITAEVASALLTLESPAALVGAIAGCFNPDEAIEGLTEEQKCEVLLALASIGADMSPQERQKAKEVLVAAVLVGQIIVGSAMIRRR
jgi:polyhydroxyalkanoate synthesis regulator phasin